MNVLMLSFAYCLNVWRIAGAGRGAATPKAAGRAQERLRFGLPAPPPGSAYQA